MIAITYFRLGRLTPPTLLEMGMLRQLLLVQDATLQPRNELLPSIGSPRGIGWLSHLRNFIADIYAIFTRPLCRQNVPPGSLESERAMYQFSVIAIGVVSVAFFLFILSGLIREMTRYKRRK